MGQTQYSIPPGIYNKFIRIIKENLKISIYTRSNLSYWLKWFCILKKDCKSLQIFHNLQPLNVVTIKDSGVPPILEFYANNIGGWGPYTGLYLFVAFHHWTLAMQSQDLTTLWTSWSLTAHHPSNGSYKLCEYSTKGNLVYHKGRNAQHRNHLCGKFKCQRTPHSLWVQQFWMVYLLHLQTFPQSAPVPCALSSDGQYFEVIPKM